MSNGTKRVYDARAKYPDRGKTTENSFSVLNVSIKNLQTALLLLSSTEEPVLQAVLSHLAEFARKQDLNIFELKQHLLLEILIDKELFINADSVIIRRFALFLITVILDNTELGEYDAEKTTQLLDVAFRFYLKEVDEFCIEYLTYIVNLCLRDPKVAQTIIENIEFLEKFKNIFVSSDNPDTVLNSIEALHKILQVQSAEEMLEFTTLPGFPVDRIVCELTNEFLEIRLASIKVLKTLLADSSEDSVFDGLQRCFFVLQQLVKAFCLDPKAPDALGIIEVLATALRSAKMTKLFFEQNLFDQMVENLKEIMDTLPSEVVCAIISIFAETAKYQKYLPRIHQADITNMFIKCLMKSKHEPAPFVIMGITRLIAHPEALRAIIGEYAHGAMLRLINLFRAPDVSIKTREQAAELIGSLLVHAFRITADQLIDLDICDALTTTLKQGLPELSIDLILSLLAIIESLADNDEYRAIMGQNVALTEQIAQLLMVNIMYICYLVGLIDIHVHRYSNSLSIYSYIILIEILTIQTLIYRYICLSIQILFVTFDF